MRVRVVVLMVVRLTVRVQVVVLTVVLMVVRLTVRVQVVVLTVVLMVVPVAVAGTCQKQGRKSPFAISPFSRAQGHGGQGGGGAAGARAEGPARGIGDPGDRRRPAGAGVAWRGQ